MGGMEVGVQSWGQLVFEIWIQPLFGFTGHRETLRFKFRCGSACLFWGSPWPPGFAALGGFRGKSAGPRELGTVLSLLWRMPLPGGLERYRWQAPFPVQELCLRNPDRKLSSLQSWGFGALWLGISGSRLDQVMSRPTPCADSQHKMRGPHFRCLGQARIDEVWLRLAITTRGCCLQASPS